MRVAVLKKFGFARLALLSTAIACGVWLAAHQNLAIAAADNMQTTPVLVELFTSEGCSDCPPADALLQRLDTTQFVPGAVAIVLSEHVTYWNHLGWRDPYSLEEMDARQQDYSARFGLNSVYTPQMVVDGADQFVGSDSRALTHAVQKAASTAKRPVEIVEPRLQNGKANFSLRTGTDKSDVRWYAAIAEDATHSEVARGENAGRTLHHVAVVRGLKQLHGDVGGQSFSLPVEGGANYSGIMRLVVFAIDPHSGKVVAVAQHTMNR
jgi:hypothetical protein